MWTSPANFRAALLALLLPAISPAPAQFPTPAPRPGMALRTPAPFATPPPFFSSTQPANGAPSREVPLVEKRFDQLSNQKISREGRVALDIEPAKWHHAETDNFIIHYRRATEAQKVVREVEYDLWFVATTLGATKDRYAKKSNVYVFEDQAEWEKFLDMTENPMKWAASYAHGDELFLNVRGGGNSGPGTSFDSHTLAHETTHAVVARIYPGKNWPLWLNEGFAEYMGGASVAARKGISARHFERDLHSAEMPLDQLTQLDQYPATEEQIRQLYQTSEKFIRFLMTEFPKDRIRLFIEAMLEGRDLPTAITSTYSDKVKDYGAFLKKYEKFTK
jgi:hypothetical protein